MKNYTILKAIALFLLAVTASALKAEDSKSDVTGMYFYASWCAACKTLEPKLEEAKGQFDDKSFNLVKFDVSNKPKQYQSKLQATSLNL